MNRYFFGQTAVYDLGQYRTEPSCKKAKKSLEPFLRKTGNQLLTNYYYCNVLRTCSTSGWPLPFDFLDLLTSKVLLTFDLRPHSASLCILSSTVWLRICQVSNGHALWADQIKWPKISIFAIFGAKFDHKGPNLGFKMLLSAPWPPLVAIYHCQR